ncbi:hypothetical protein BJX64DRAFT_266050 [Aspergillus heterothallicus]
MYGFALLSSAKALELAHCSNWNSPKKKACVRVSRRQILTQLGTLTESKEIAQRILEFPFTSSSSSGPLYIT